MLPTVEDNLHPRKIKDKNIQICLIMLIFLIFKVSFTIIIVLVVNGQHLITDLDLIIDLNIY